MIIKPLNLFVLLIILFSYIISQNIQIIDFNGEEITEYGSESKTYQIKLSTSFQYLHIKVESSSEKNPIVSISSTDTKCKNNRKLLGMQTYGPINLFLKEKETQNFEYLCIKCIDEESCIYSIKIKSGAVCQLSLGEQYSYLVNENNKQMAFNFEENQNESPSECRIFFWVKGQNRPFITPILENPQNKYNFDYGEIFTSEYKKNGRYLITISGQEGDYITVGSLFIDDYESKTLRVNDQEKMGILTQDKNEICFPIEKKNNIGVGDLLKINGIIYTKRASTYFKQNGNIKEESIKTIENGLIQDFIFNFDFNSEDLYCIRNLFDNTNNTEIIFSLQLTSNKNDNLNRIIYPPHLPGIIYSHYLFKGEMAIFQAMKPQNYAKEISFNMKAKKGFPDMRFDECKDFPNCIYYPESLDTSSNPQHSNRMTVYSFYLDNDQKRDFSPISSYQPLLIVNCIEGTNENEISQFCEFETSIFTNADRLNLIKGETYSQYLLEDEYDLYTINIKDQEYLKKVYLDLIIFSGDVDLEIESNLESHKYFISNKIFYSIQTTSTDQKVDFRVRAYKNSFYMVQYQLVKTLYQNENKNSIESGVNYIQSILVGDTAALYKEITFTNLKFYIKSPFLASFYSQNCKFVVSRTLKTGGIDTIQLYDSYGQIIIDNDDPYSEFEKYTFRIDITEADVSKYEGKLCMLYITGLELSNSNTGSERYISVSDGVPQYYIFTQKYPFMKYSFHVSDVTKALIINFNLIDKTSYFVEVLCGYVPFIERTIYRNEQIIVYASQLQEKCLEEDEVCTINVNIELENKDDERERKLETTIFQYKGAPIYLEKNAVKQDILIGNEKKYYYFDIGKDEMGDITIDYKRGSGYIYAKVVPKTNMEYDPEAEWRGIYTFPKDKDDSLRYESYLKKIIIDTDDTKDCENGCYVLIAIMNSFYRENSKFDEETAFLPYRISITPKISNSEYFFEENAKPKVKIRVNEFIIGNIYPTLDKIYEFYEVNLPFESEYILIDWQADKSSLFINVGDERPTIDSHDFEFSSTGYDTTFKLTKTQILNKQNSNVDTLRNIHLTLGLWNNQVDTLYTSVYAFKLSMPPTYIEEDMESIEIIHIRSDQKVQCDPSEIEENTYLCVFAVIFDDSDVNGTLVVYPKAQNENVEIEFRGAVIDAEPIERNDLFFIYDQIVNLDEDYTSEYGDKFIYVEKIEKKKCLFFIAYCEELTTIEVLSSTYLLTNNQVFSPNPSTAQIFALGDNSIKFNFETHQDLLINIVSISGEGQFYWDTKEEKDIKFYLNGFEDRLTLTSGTFIEENQLSYLVAKSNSVTLLEKNKAGFVFYMTFYPRNNQINIDQLKIGRSTEFNYRKLEFPISYFSRLTDEDISISFTFLNYYLNKNEQLTYNKPLFKIWGKVIKEEDAINARYDKYYWPVNDDFSIKGTFDGPFASLFLSSKDIQKFDINKEENPFIFFSIELNEEISTLNFNELGLEVGILKEPSENGEDLFVNDNVYYNGKFSNDKDISSHVFKYKLRYDTQNPKIRIEFSANSDLIKYAVTIDKNSKTDYEGLINVQKKYLNGRDIMTFEVPKIGSNSLYLIIYHDKDNDINPKLTNYIFKYIFGNYINEFYEFPIKNDTLEITESERNGLKTYTISFYPIQTYDVTYYIKGVYSNSEIIGEKKDTIAISESEGYYVQVDNPNLNENSKISINLRDLEQEISFIKVLAKVHYNSLSEFVLYQPFIIKEEPISLYEDIPPSQGLIQLNYNTSLGLYMGFAGNAYKTQKYKLYFDEKNKISNYINIISYSKENKIIYISTSDQNGKKDRIQLFQSGNDQLMDISIKKEEIEYNYLFIVVECLVKDQERCNYTLEVSGLEYAMFYSLFNYYVSKNNKLMTFKLFETIEENTNPVLSVYAKGGKSVKLTLTDKSGKQYPSEQLRNGVAIAIKTNEPEFYLKVEGEEGDYISIGENMVLDGKSQNNILEPNGNQISGFLKRGILEKECYLLYDKDNTSPSYLVVLFYNKLAEISFKDENFRDIYNSKEIIKKGYYMYIHGESQNKNRKYICIGMPSSYEYDLNNLEYSLQLTKSTNQGGISNLYSPLLSGNIYPKILKRGTYTFFNAVYLNSLSDEIIYNILATEGSPKMYLHKCTNYPMCEINFENKQNLIPINELNRMSLWRNKEKNASPIDAEQYVMVVQCEELGRSDSDVCQFQASIYGNKDDIYLIEGQQFSQYLLQNKNSRYVIDFSGDKTVTKVFIDIFVISGDVDIKLKNEEGKNDMKSLKYYLSNKIFYSVSKADNSNFKNIFVNIEAQVNSYYIIEYKLIRESANEDTYDVYDGINYLIPISNEGNAKTINIHNLKLLSEDFYLANFYSLNCNIKINRINQNGKEEGITSSFLNSGQDIISKDNSKGIDVHSYSVSIVEKDSSQYNNNLCMLYASGLEMTQNTLAQKEILLSEGIPHKTVFMQPLSKIKYVYPNPDTTKSIAINFKVINPANYTCSIIFNNGNRQEKYFLQSNIEYVENTDINNNCTESDLCSIIVLIEVFKQIENYVPTLEVSIRQIDNIPFYFSKGVLRHDFVAADSWTNLYTIVGKNEEGYINIDFARGSGLIYAKVLPINGAGDNSPDWRQYKFPRKQKGTLKYDFYNQKILFKKEDTAICDEGCYLLISLQSSAIGKFNEQFRFFDFAMTVSIIPDKELKKNGPIIKIEPEEYIVGSLTDSEKIKNKDMYEFYQLNIPFDADKIEIDWQSSTAKLLLNVGENRPTMDSALIKKEFRSDTIFEISRSDLKLFGNNIANTLLTIGVYTENMESEFGTHYSFRVHFVKKLNIYKVTSDHKTLCKPTQIDTDEYRCLFMIIYNELDFLYDVMAYAKSQNPTAFLYMVANFIDKDIYDQLDMDKLDELIPDGETAAYNTYADSLDFIFLTLSDFESHFYINVLTDKPDTIEFITSFKTFDTELSPNPSTTQLFSINNNPLMTLKFKTTKPIFINFVSLYGKAKIYLEDEKNTIYHLRDRDDRLSLAIPPNTGKETILIIENLNYNNDTYVPDDSEEETIEKPEVAFYLDYYLRSLDKNLDEINLGKTAEIVYKQSDFPIYYYSRLNDLNNDINIFFNLHDLELADNKLEQREIKSEELVFKGSVISQNTVYQLITDKNLKPNNEKSVSGKYDPALQIGQIYLTSENLKTNEENPTLYLSFEKQQSSNVAYKSIRLELTAVEKNRDIPVTEKLYQYGTILNKDDINSYKLKIGNKTGEFRIQFAANSKNINFSINNEKGKKTNSTYDNTDTKRARGKIFITFKAPDLDYIYLNVFLNDKVKNPDKRLNHYAFKYINANDRENFFEYPILDNSAIEKTVNKNNINVKFNRINKDNLDIIYSLKIGKKWEYSKEELNNTIALSESPSYVTQVHNPKGDKINLNMSNIGDDYSYIEVFALIKDGPIIEYVAYDPIYKSEKKEEEESSNSALFIVVYCFIGIVIIIMVLVVILLLNNKNKDLLEKVNKISFAQEDNKESKVKEENLLLDEGLN